MASIAVTNAWSDPTGALTDGQVYSVQNRATGPVYFFEGPTFDATTNANDGLLLTPLHDGGSGPNHMRWTYSSANQVRLRMDGGIAGTTNVVEFALGA